MKNKIIKSIALILGITLVFTSGVVAAKLSAIDIKYKDTNVQDALDSIYQENKSYKFRLNSDSNNDVEGSSVIEFHDKKYKYFKITSLIKDSNVGICYITGWSSNKSQHININLNQEYEILSSDDDYKFSGIIIRSSSAKKIWSRCYAQIELYN